eukprot:13446126-Alexandrium_andersonii.AAC.1
MLGGSMARQATTGRAGRAQSWAEAIRGVARDWPRQANGRRAKAGTRQASSKEGGLRQARASINKPAQASHQSKR